MIRMLKLEFSDTLVSFLDKIIFKKLYWACSLNDFFLKKQRKKKSNLLRKDTDVSESFDF